MKLIARLCKGKVTTMVFYSFMVYGLFNSIVSSPYYIALNGEIIC